MSVREKNTSSKQRSFVLRGIFRAAMWPLILLEISTAGSDFINAFVVGHFIGADELAALGIGGPYFSIIGVISGLVATGMQSMCAAEYSKGDTERMNRVYSLAVFVSSVLALAMSLAFLFCGNSVGVALGATGDAARLLPQLAGYLWGLGWGTVALVLAAILMPAVQLDGGKRYVNASVAARIILTVIFDIILVLRGFGLLGVGIATSIGQWGQLGVLLAYACSRKSSLHFSIHGMSLRDLGSMVAIGLPKATRRASNMLRPMLLNRTVIALGGSVAMGAMTVRNGVEGMADSAGAGIASAVMLVVSVLFGEMNREGIHQISLQALRDIFVFVGGVGLVLIVGAPWIAPAFAGGDPQVTPLAINALRWLAVYLVLNAIVESYICLMQATRQMVKTHALNIAARFVCPVACAYALGEVFGIDGVWMGFAAGSAALLATIVLVTMIRRRSFRITLEDLLGLSDSFGVDEKDVLQYTATTVDEGLSKIDDVHSFLQEHDYDKHRVLYATLCVEEMVKNVVEHGFAMDGHKHSVDVRLVAEKDEVVLRIRDDCPLFNVKEKGLQWKADPDDPARHIGIRLTMKAATDLKYVSTFGTNNLIIRV